VRSPITFESGRSRRDAAHQDVVRLDVGVDDVELAQEAEGKEELVGVSPDCPQVDADVLAEALDDLAQVEAQALEDEAEVAAVLKGALEADDVLPVVRVGLVQATQDEDLFLACLVPVQNTQRHHAAACVSARTWSPGCAGS
jgi:hypothetical protein